MLNDIALYSAGATRPLVRPVTSRTGQEDFGPRSDPGPAARPRAKGAALTQPPSPALGDDKAARDLARLARRYAMAARMATRTPG